MEERRLEMTYDEWKTNVGGFNAPDGDEDKRSPMEYDFDAWWCKPWKAGTTDEDRLAFYAGWKAHENRLKEYKDALANER